jgi:predicted AAA+ superfamily ATPase
LKQQYFHIILEELKAFGAVLLTDPKWCGKTTTAKQIAKSVQSMQSPDNQESFSQLAEIKPSILLEGENPRLIDEWQMASQLWDAMRHDVDERGDVGLYIMTGHARWMAGDHWYE